MKKRRNPNKQKVPTAADLLIRVQLNANTIITITKLKTFAAWKEKFPEARIVSPAELVTE